MHLGIIRITAIYKNHNLEENIFYWAVLFPVMSPSFFVRSLFADPFPEKNTDPNPLTNQNRKIFFLLQDSIEFVQMYGINTF